MGVQKKRKERKKARASILSSKRQIVKTMAELEPGLSRGQSRPGADLIVWEISDLEKKKYFWFFFSSEDSVICWTGRVDHVRREPPTAKREAQQPKHGNGGKALPLILAVAENHRWGSRKQVWINYWNLIKNKTVDEIRPLGNKRNNYITSIFAENNTETGDRDRIWQSAVKKSIAPNLKLWARPSETEKRESQVSNGNLTKKENLAELETAKQLNFLKGCVCSCN